MKDKTRKRIFFLFILAGLAILNYPFISQRVNQRSQSSIIRAYQNETEHMEIDERKKILDEADKYNAALTKSRQGVADAFLDEKQTDEAYHRLLNAGNDGIMGYLEIPKIKVFLPVYHGVSVRVLERGVGHLYGSSLPVGGKNTHAVLSSHRGLPSKELFTDLDQIKTGDCFFLTMMGRKLAYEVDQIRTVLPEETEDLRVIPGKDYVTLVTCTPYGVNSHRLLVRGTRIPWKEEKVQEQKEKTAAGGISQILKWIFIFSCIAITAAGKILLFPGKKRKRRKRYEKNEK